MKEVNLNYYYYSTCIRMLGRPGQVGYQAILYLTSHTVFNPDTRIFTEKLHTYYGIVCGICPGIIDFGVHRSKVNVIITDFFFF